MKAIALISSGIDSPVAAHIMQKKGYDIIFLHMNTGGSKDAVQNIVEKIAPGAELIIRDHVPFLSKAGKTRFTCVLCKRKMLKEAEALAKEKGAECIITGENIGQVASQTLDNMAVISDAVNLPILRPLLCFEKNETVAIARKISTYDLATNEKCMFVPDKPATKSRREIIERIESEIEG